MDTYKLFKELLEKGYTKDEILKTIEKAEDAIKEEEKQKEKETQNKLKIERAKQNLIYAVESYLNAVYPHTDRSSNKKKAAEITESFIEDLTKTNSKTSYYIGGKRATKEEFDKYINNLCKYFY